MKGVTICPKIFTNLVPIIYLVANTKRLVHVVEKSKAVVK